ncbi:phage late control D family protein [Silvimonas sp.]|uniref:phage late control D family protein n=1 Tax=Silvimonas sp. TaxID=2650811 RepID=UPI00284939B3|nr:phage late control D family protein [Silvimonas sp.]MDR3429008.1 phage late control D family protein [Silvimonas sp.]
MGVLVPRYRLQVNGKDITSIVENRLESLSLSVKSGFEADQLDLSLHDHDGRLALPPRQAEIRVWLGWEDLGLVDCGRYNVDEVEHSGSPDRLRITARSADFCDGLLQQYERSYHGKTIGQIVASIATESKLTPVVSPALASQVVDHIDQTRESDANFLTRLARRYDAIATVKSGKLLFMPMGEAKTASGKPIERVTITRQSGDQHRYTVADRDNFSGVKACYQNVKGAKTASVLVGKEGNVKTLHHTYASKANAQRAAESHWQRIQRGTVSFSLTLARGRVDLCPETPVTVSGFKPEIDDTTWILRDLQHSLDGSGGLTTTAQFDKKIAEVADDQ